MKSNGSRSPSVKQNGKRAPPHEFLRYLPAVRTHAAIQFRHLPSQEREECVAEAVAAAFVNYQSAVERGKASRVTPGSLAEYAVKHVRGMRHVGGAYSTTDVLSPSAQYARGFRVHSLAWDDSRVYDCISDPASPTWRQVLLEDKSTPVPEQVAFRIDWSAFLRGQTDRTRQAMDLLAAGYKRCEVSDYLGTTASAVTQRMARVEREWERFSGALRGPGRGGLMGRS